MKKRKRVTFGEELSPEVFDESLPANTPLCKGGTPARQDFNRISPQLPEESPVPEHLPQPDFDDKGENLVSGKAWDKLAYTFIGFTCFQEQ